MTPFTFASGPTRGLVEYAVARGADRAELLRRAEIDAAQIEDADHRVAYPDYLRLMRTAQALTGDAALALHWTEDVNLARMSIVGLLGEASTTLLESFQQVQRYGRLVTDIGRTGRFEMVSNDQGLWTVDRRPDPNAFPELTETTFGFMICGSRVAGPSTWLKAIHVTHSAPSYAAEYERIFGVPVVFSSHWNATHIDPSFLTTPVNVQPRYVFGVLRQHADAQLEALNTTGSTRAEVERLILPILHTGDVGIDRVAAELGVTRQTLHRRLRAEGATYARLLDDLRRRLAMEYLANPRVSINETAFLVGFSEPAAFSRAFKRWSGQSPREARQVMRAQENASRR